MSSQVYRASSERSSYDRSVFWLDRSSSTLDQGLRGIDNSCPQIISQALEGRQRRDRFARDVPFYFLQHQRGNEQRNVSPDPAAQ